MAQKDKVKELVGRSLDSYHTKALQQMDRIEKKNKEQNHKINILTNELDNDYITKSEEGSVISLEHSKEGMVYIDGLEGNTLVNYCTDGSKELTLNDEIDTEGINVTLNNTIDNGIVDISLEGNTMVNVCDQKEPVAITKSYTVENSGNHIALQGEYDGKCRPVVHGNTMVNYCTDGAKELTLNGDIDVEGTNVTLTEGVDGGKVDVVCEGNTLVNLLLNKELKITCNNDWDNFYAIGRPNVTSNITFGNTIQDVKPNTTYTLIYNVVTRPTSNHYLINNANASTVFDTYVRVYSDTPLGINKVVLTTLPDLTNKTVVLRQQNGTGRGKVHIKDYMLLEGDWTNKEIPQYFEGMKSVGECEDNKIEILSTTKNLCSGWVNGNISENGIENTETNNMKTDFIKVLPNTYYICSNNGIKRATHFIYYDKNKVFIGASDRNNPTEKCLTPYNCHYVRLTGGVDLRDKFQFEIGEIITSYNSISLSNKKEISLNEPLRALPNGVCDKVVKLGGKHYVERNCGEFVFNGSESGWNRSNSSNDETTTLYYVKKVGRLSQSIGLCDKFKTLATFSPGQPEGIYFGTDINIRINKSRLSLDTIDGFKQWLSENPTTVVYQLETPIYEELLIDPTINTYTDTTHISNNSTIPCNMKIQNSGYNAIIKPSTQYTVALDCDKGQAIEVGLGGAKTTTTNNVTTITTPSTLTNNNLELYGKGVTVSNAMVFEGDVTSNLPSGYVEGLKSSFEDQLAPTNINTSSPNLNGLAWGSRDGDYIVFDNPTAAGNVSWNVKGKLKPNTTYTLISECTEIFNNGYNLYVDMFPDTYSEIGTINRVGEVYFKFTTPSDISTLATIRIYVHGVSKGRARFRIPILLEGDYTSNPPTYEDVVNYGGKYKVEYKVTGRNKFSGVVSPKYKDIILFNKDSDDILTAVNKSYDSRAWNYSSCQYYVKLSKGTYTVTLETVIANTNQYAQVRSYSPQNTTVFAFGINDVSTVGAYTKSFTLSEDLEIGIIGKFFDGAYRIQIEEGTQSTSFEKHKEYTKTFYLNSPLLEGDTIEDINGKATHVKRYGKVVLDGSEDESWRRQPELDTDTIERYWISQINNGQSLNIKPNTTSYNDKFISGPIDGTCLYTHNEVARIDLKRLKADTRWTDLTSLRQWLQANPVTVVYELASPVYETISEESILCDSYVNGHLDFDSVVPIEKVQFPYWYKELSYVKDNTNYILQFNSDNIGVLDWASIGGKRKFNIPITKGMNRISITTATDSNRVIGFGGIGFNASNIQVVETDKEFEYFEGMKSVGECEDNKIEILSSKNIAPSSSWKYTNHGIEFNFGSKTINENVYVHNISNKHIMVHTSINQNYSRGFRVEKNSKKLIELNEDEVIYCTSVNRTDGWSDSDVEKARNSFIITKKENELNKKEISLNEPLRGLPNGVKDKVVKVGGKWYIKRNCKQVRLDYSMVVGISPVPEMPTLKYYQFNLNDRLNHGTVGLSNTLKHIHFDNRISPNSQEFYFVISSQASEKRMFVKMDANIDFTQWLIDNPTEIIYPLETPTYEEITDPTLITYLDTTHISNNSTIPCNMTVKNTGYNAIIKPSTLYTVALDTNNSGTIGLNLGGAKVTTTNNVATITTPATLTDDGLRLYGKGIKASKVRLLEGDKTSWIPSHFEGMKSSFEDKLQEDGTFKMEILSNNRNLLDSELVLHGTDRVTHNKPIYFQKGHTYTFAIEGLASALVDNSIQIFLMEHAGYPYPTTDGERGVVQLITSWARQDKYTFVPIRSGYFYIQTRGSQDTIISMPNVVVVEGVNVIYEENKSNKIQFSSIEPLRGLPNGVKDRFVFKDGKLMIERNTIKIVLNGSEAWGIYPNQINRPLKSKCYYMVGYDKFDISDNNSVCDIFSNVAHCYNSADINCFSDYHTAPNKYFTSFCNTLEEFKEYLKNNNATLVGKIKKPTYEEIPFELQKIILEGYENGMLFIDTNIPPTVTTTYAGETPIVKATRLNKSEVLNNTNDINDNIVPYLMDMDYRVVCLQLEGGIENVSMARLFGGTYEMLQRDILSNRYSKEEYKYRLDAYLSANKITHEEYTKLGDMLNE